MVDSTYIYFFRYVEHGIPVIKNGVCALLRPAANILNEKLYGFFYTTSPVGHLSRQNSDVLAIYF